ncbi:putative nuclease HARBI1 [Topomyia yanbarensis]|uniref:putative nuclease HARBI1 n=1 Tax=Topomyia yanbarensis TaxID=2498891 RepID=UPI00273C5D1A|nr:putative nuclease HARBI1 [Topomyia yanbarensis]
MYSLNFLPLPLPLIAGINNWECDPIRAVKIYTSRRFGDDRNFKDLYRFSRQNVDRLVELFLADYDETRGGALSNTHKMKCFLRYVGDPGFQGIGEDLGVHQTTVCKTVWNVCQAIVGKAHEWIKFPLNVADLEQDKKIWQSKYSFPSAIGAIDCTHILIKSPHSFKDEFINRKGLYSFNVQATCNASELFTSVDCRWAGSVHDARIWRNSDIYNTIHENESGAILLGDEAYPLTPWLMTPYRNPVSDPHKKYNILHTKERVIIERLFGQVKQRFPILQSKIRIKTDRVPSMIIACFVLHNVAKILNDGDFEVPEGSTTSIPVPVLLDRNVTVTMRGKNRREAIAAFVDNNNLLRIR